MKKKILPIILLFFTLQNGISQEEPRLQKNIQTRKFQDKIHFQKDIEEIYSYDNLGNISSIIKTKYDSDEEIEYIRGTFFEYNSKNLIQKKTIRRYNADVDLWISIYWIDYEYNSNDCLILEKTTLNIGDYFSKKTYTRNSNCQILTLHKENSSSSNYFLERVYLSDGISYEERFYNNSSFADSTLPNKLSIQTFNEKELLVNSHEIFMSTDSILFFERKYTYEYDIFNNIIKEQRFQKQQDSLNWELLEDLNYYNDYDENGFLVKTKYEEIGYGIGQIITNPDFNIIFEYKNSCEGLVEERLYYLQGFNHITKNEYIYGGKNECLDLEKITLKGIVFPNPSKGYFEIESPIFKSGNTGISVFSTDGKVLLQKNEISRCESSSIDLSFLPNGFYILHLSNGDHFVKEKIVIAK